MLAFPYDQGV